MKEAKKLWDMLMMTGSEWRQQPCRRGMNLGQFQLARRKSSKSRVQKLTEEMAGATLGILDLFLDC